MRSTIDRKVKGKMIIRIGSRNMRRKWLSIKPRLNNYSRKIESVHRTWGRSWGNKMNGSKKNGFKSMNSPWRLLRKNMSMLCALWGKGSRIKLELWKRMDRKLSRNYSHAIKKQLILSLLILKQRWRNWRKRSMRLAVAVILFKNKPVKKRNLFTNRFTREKRRSQV